MSEKFLLKRLFIVLICLVLIEYSHKIGFINDQIHSNWVKISGLPMLIVVGYIVIIWHDKLEKGEFDKPKKNKR
jgi:hypothetical protein